MTFKYVLQLYLLWQIVLIAVSAISPKIWPVREPFFTYNRRLYYQNPILYSRANFDGEHYLSIARKGYAFGQQPFFPLYPSLIRFLNGWGFDPVIAGLVITSMAFLLALLFLIRLVEMDYPAPIAKFTLLAFLAFPASFYFGLVYTEALFMFFVLGSFYFARRRHRWLAAIFGLLAANTRFIGVMLFPALLIEFWQQDQSLSPTQKLIRLLPALLVPLGLASYMLFLQTSVGDPLAFFRVQKIFGPFRSDRVILLYQVFWRYAKMILTVDRSQPIYFTVVYELAVSVAFVVLSTVSIIKKMRLSYVLFSLLAYIFPTFTGSFVSLPRYVLACFPAFILIGQLLSRHPRFVNLYLAGSGLAMAVIFSLFSRGYWVG